MNYETITVEKRENGVALLTINRPDTLNALNRQVHAEGVAALDDLRRDSSVRVLVITGAGEKSFIAGADIGEFAGQTPVTQRALFHEKTFFNSIDSFPKPTIAMRTLQLPCKAGVRPAPSQRSLPPAPSSSIQVRQPGTRD